MSILLSLVVILTIYELISFWVMGRNVSSLYGEFSLGMHVPWIDGDELRLVGVKRKRLLMHDWKSPQFNEKTKGFGITSEKEYV